MPISSNRGSSGLNLFRGRNKKPSENAENLTELAPALRPDAPVGECSTRLMPNGHVEVHFRSNQGFGVLRAERIQDTWQLRAPPALFATLRNGRYARETDLILAVKNVLRPDALSIAVPQHGDEASTPASTAPKKKFLGALLRPVKQKMRAANPAILQQPASVPAGMDDTKEVAQILADAATSGSTLRGANKGRMAKHMVALLRSVGDGRWLNLMALRPQLAALTSKFSDYADLADLIDNVATASERATYCAKTARVVESLEPGQSVFIPGGWRGGRDGNHAMVYEVQRQSAFGPKKTPRYTLTVYNSGGGLEYHAGMLSADGTRLKYEGIVRYRDVPLEKISKGGEAAPWWSALQEPLMPLHPGVQHSEREIYATVLPQCGGIRDSIPEDVRRFFTGQRGGSCTWKVLLTVAREEFTVPQYKAVKFELQGSALLGFVDARAPRLSSADVYVFEKGLENLRGAAAKLVRSRGMNKAQLASFNESAQAAQATMTALIKRDPPGKRFRFTELRTSASGIPEEVTAAPPWYIDSGVATVLPAPTFGPGASIQDILSAAIQYARSCHGAGRALSAYHLSRACAALPLPTPGEATDAHWDRVDALQTLESLSTLLDHYFNAAVVTTTLNYGASILGCMQVVAAIDKVAHRALGPHWSALQFDWRSCFRESLQMPEIDLSPAQRRQLDEVWRYFVSKSTYSPSVTVVPDALPRDQFLVQALHELDNGSARLSDSESAKRLLPLATDMGDDQVLTGKLRAFARLRRTYFLMSQTRDGHVFANPHPQGTVEAVMLSERNGVSAADTTWTFSFTGLRDRSIYKPHPQFAEVRTQLLLDSRVDENRAIILQRSGMAAQEGLSSRDAERVMTMARHPSLRATIALSAYLDHLLALRERPSRDELDAALRAPTKARTPDEIPMRGTALGESLVASQLHVLIQRGFSTFSAAQGDAAPIIFLARWATALREAQAELGVLPGIGIADPQAVLEGAIAEFTGSLSDRAALHVAWLECIPRNMLASPSTGDIVNIADHAIRGRLADPSTKSADAFFGEAARRNLLALHPALADALKDPNTVERVGRVADAVIDENTATHQNRAWRLLDGTILATSNHTLDLLNGGLLRDGVPCVGIVPKAYREDAFYRSIFGVQPLPFTLDGKTLWLDSNRSVSIGIAQQPISATKQFTVAGITELYRTQRTHKESAYIFARAIDSRYTQVPQVLQATHRVWLPDASSLPPVVTDSDGNPVYSMREDSSREIAYQALQDPQLAGLLAPVANAAAFPAAIGIEDSNYAMVWERDKVLEVVDLPRYGLRFRRSDDGSVRWTEHPHLQVESRNSPFASFRAYVPLLSDAGTRSILLPWGHIDNEASPSPFGVGIALKPGTLQSAPGALYFACSVDANGAMVASSPEQALQIATIYLADRQPKEALQYVRSARALGTASNAAWEMTARLVQFLNLAPYRGDPNVAAVGAALVSIVSQNLRGESMGALAARVPAAANLTRLEPWFANAMLQYGNLRGNMNVDMLLTTHEEIDALRWCKGKDLQLEARHRYLLGQRMTRAMAAVQKPSDKFTTYEVNAASVIEMLALAVRARPEPVASLSFLFPGADMSRAFVEMAKVATGSDQGAKTALTARLHLMSFDASRSNKSMRALLFCALADEETSRALAAYVNTYEALGGGDPSAQEEQFARKVAHCFITALDFPDILEVVNAERQLVSSTDGNIVADGWLMAREGDPLGPMTPSVSLGDPPANSVDVVAAVSKYIARSVQVPGEVEYPPFATGGDPVLQESMHLWLANVKAAQGTALESFALAGNFDELKSALQAQLDAIDIDVKTSDLETRSNFVDPNHPTAELYALDVAGKRILPITTDTLRAHLISNNMMAIKALNPQLTDADVEDIKRMTLEWLVAKSAAQQCQRGLELVVEMAAAEESTRQQLGDQLGSLLLAQRCFSPREHPELLVFEVSANLVLRRNQVEILQRMQKQDADGEYVATIEQLNMGSGKTKVLLPILAAKKADGKRLPVVMVPRALLAEVQRDLKVSSERGFGQACQTFEFARSTPRTVESLTYLRDMLLDTIERRQYLVTTREAVQSFKVAYQAALHGRSDSYEQLQLMSEILGIFAQKGHLHIDEADTLLDVRSELNFTNGRPESVPGKRLDLLTSLYSEIIMQPTVQVGLQSNRQSLLSDTAYNTMVVSVAKSMLSNFDAFKAFKGHIGDDVLVDYLINPNAKVPEGVSRLHKLPDTEEACGLLALLRGELTNLLKITLRRNTNEHYGIDRDGFAVPFSLGKPVTGAQFGNAYEAINYTLQTYLFRGVTADELFQRIASWKIAAADEAQVENGVIDDTASAEAFAAFVKGTCLEGRSVSTFADAFDEGLLRFVAELKADTKRLLTYVRQEILPKVQVFPEQLSSSAHDLVDTFANVQGFSGTMWNAATFHPRLDVQLRPDTDAMLARIFFNPQKTTTAMVADTSTSSILLAAADQRPEGVRGLNALIDAGAFFKGVENHVVAEQLAAFFAQRTEQDILAIRYLDDQTKRVKLLSVGDKPLDNALSNAQVFTFYGQEHITGVDLPQAATATGIVTMSAQTLLRDLQQAALRMRQLDQGQRCVVVFPRELAPAMHRDEAQHGTPGMVEIQTLAMRNQASLLGPDKVRAVKMALSQQVRSAALQMCLASGNDAYETFRLTAPLLVTRTADDPFLLFGSAEQQDSRWVIQQHAQMLASNVANVLRSLFYRKVDTSGLKAVKSRLESGLADELISRAGALPPDVRHTVGEEPATGTEVQQETNMEMRVETRATRGFQQPASPAMRWRPADLLRPNSLFESLRDEEAEKQAYAQWFKSRIASERSRRTAYFSGNSRGYGGDDDDDYSHGRSTNVFGFSSQYRSPWPSERGYTSRAGHGAYKSMPPLPKARPADAVFRRLNTVLEKPWFAENLYASTDFLKTSAYSDHDLGSPFQRPVYFFAMVKDADEERPENCKFVLLSAHEVAELLDAATTMEQVDAARSYVLCDQRGTPLLHGPSPMPEAFLKSEAFDRIVMQVRYLNQQVTQERLMTRHQRELGNAWRSQASAVGMDAFFEKASAR